MRIGGIVFDPVSFAFQSVLFGFYRSFFIIGWKKDAVCVSLTHVFLITADRDYCFNNVRCKSISPNRLGGAILYKAFVEFRLLMLWFSIPFSDKTIDLPAVSANPTIDYSKNYRSRRHEQPIPPIMKNVRYKLGNPTETRAIQSRTQIAAQHSELGIIDLHRIPATYIAPSPRQPICPAAADNPRVRS